MTVSMIDSSPARLDWKGLVSGDSIHQAFIWQPGGVPTSLTGWGIEARFQTSSMFGTVPLATLTIVNGGVVLDNQTTNPGRFTLTADTAGWATTEAGIWEIELTSPTGVVTTLLRGSLQILQDFA